MFRAPSTPAPDRSGSKVAASWQEMNFETTQKSLQLLGVAHCNIAGWQIVSLAFSF